jgi:hypothetical protein
MSPFFIYFFLLPLFVQNGFLQKAPFAPKRFRLRRHDFNFGDFDTSSFGLRKPIPSTRPLEIASISQGCQMFLGTKYQNGGNVYQNATKLPNDLKIYRMAKYILM